MVRLSKENRVVQEILVVIEEVTLFPLSQPGLMEHCGFVSAT